MKLLQTRIAEPTSTSHQSLINSESTTAESHRRRGVCFGLHSWMDVTARSQSQRLETNVSFRSLAKNSNWPHFAAQTIFLGWCQQRSRLPSQVAAAAATRQPKKSQYQHSPIGSAQQCCRPPPFAQLQWPLNTSSQSATFTLLMIERWKEWARFK